MASVTPPSLEDNSGPPAKSQGQPLESLTSAQIEQDCSEILLGIISEAVTCSEEGTHGPTGALTSCVSATCSLGGVSPPQDLALALSNLVSSNSPYKRKTLFICGACKAIIRNTTACPCGSAKDFPALLFKRKVGKLENTSTNTITSPPPTQVSLHKWARVILTSHGVMFAGLLTSATGMVNLTTCSCFTTTPPVSTSLEIETEETLALDTSGSLFLDKEVGTNSKKKNNKSPCSALTSKWLDTIITDH